MRVLSWSQLNYIKLASIITIKTKIHVQTIQTHQHTDELMHYHHLMKFFIKNSSSSNRYQKNFLHNKTTQKNRLNLLNTICRETEQLFPTNIMHIMNISYMIIIKHKPPNEINANCLLLSFQTQIYYCLKNAIE